MYQLSRSPQLVAHMGYSAVEPANTVKSAVAAQRAGADMIEIDVSLTSDGHAVALHGPRLDTTTTGSGRIAVTALADLDGVLAYHRGEPVVGAAIPEIAEIVDATTSAAFNFDLKVRGAIGPVLALISQRNLVDRSVISGAKWQRVVRIRRRRSGVGVLVNLNRLDGVMAATRLRTWWLLRRYGRLLRQPDVLGLNLHHRFIDATLVDAVHSRGAQVWTFTVDDQAEIDRVIAAGVDSVTTNRPGELDLPQTDL